MLFIFKAFLNPFNSPCKYYISILEVEMLPCPMLSKNSPHLGRPVQIQRDKPCQNQTKCSPKFRFTLLLPSSSNQRISVVSTNHLLYNFNRDQARNVTGMVKLHQQPRSWHNYQFSYNFSIKGRLAFNYRWVSALPRRIYCRTVTRATHSPSSSAL